jgi:hypothetical protein
MYSEVVYFDGAHFAHIAAYEEHRRLFAVHLSMQQRCREGSSQRAREAWNSYLATAPSSPPVSFPRHIQDVQSM